MVTPFVFLRPGFVTQEASSTADSGASWRKLSVLFPPNIESHRRKQVFHFDQENLLRKMECGPDDFAGSAPAQYVDAYQTFSSFTLPTLRRSRAIKPDKSAAPEVPLLDFEIFDAAFD
jgi:hypothetical protein